MSLDVQAYLKQQVEAWETLGARVPPIGNFVLKYGRPYAAQPLPKNVRPMKPKECFSNAQRLVFRKTSLVYVEGYALRPGLFPIHHGWAVDSEGNVVDPTWREPETCRYFGVPFKRRYCAERMVTLGWIGSLLDCHQDRFALVREEIDVKTAIWVKGELANE